MEPSPHRCGMGTFPLSGEIGCFLLAHDKEIHKIVRPTWNSSLKLFRANRFASSLIYVGKTEWLCSRASALCQNWGRSGRQTVIDLSFLRSTEVDQLTRRFLIFGRAVWWVWWELNQIFCQKSCKRPVKNALRLKISAVFFSWTFSGTQLMP